jgi:hypothetical protein
MLEAVRGVAQHGLARLPWEQEVAGSNPVAPTNQQLTAFGGRFKFQAERKPTFSPIIKTSEIA